MAIIDKLSAIGDAIRTKTGKSAQMQMADMPSEILSISSGGGVTEPTFGYISTAWDAMGYPTKGKWNGGGRIRDGYFSGYSATYSQFQYLTEISGLETVTRIGNVCFNTCTSMVSVNFEQINSGIPLSAFSGCSSLAYASFGVALPSLGASVFNNCTSLITCVLRRTAAIVALSDVNAFANTPIANGTGYIYVPAALVDAYKADAKWATYANQIRAIEDYPEITATGA